MGSIEIKVDKNNLDIEFQEKATESPGKFGALLDDLAEIYLKEMLDLTPELSGETKRQTQIESEGEFYRVIFSNVDYWNALVGGHKVFGPIFSDRQRRWWFWYLHTELGGVYERKTDGYKGGDDYPLEAFYNAEDDIDAKIDEFMEWLIE